MFPAIVHRGPHAYGWMSYNPDTGIDIVKYEGRADTAEALVTMDLDPEAAWFVGHVRYATHGDPEYMGNNHPLVHGQIVGVHNGVLRKHSYEAVLAETGREDDAAEVDSEAIFAAVNKWGMRAGLARIDGDMVTVFASTKEPEILRIARSYGRPLVYATTAAGSLIFASECCVIDACGIDTKAAPVELMSRYALLTVKGGRITQRDTYRHDTWKRYEGGTRGITDYFDRAPDGCATTRTSPDLPRVTGSLPPLPPRRKGKKKGGGIRPDSRPAVLKPNQWGDTYLGSGVYRLADGRILTVEQYVEHRIEVTMYSDSTTTNNTKEN